MTTDSTAEHQHTLFYAHDPMCSWCWAFKPRWQSLQSSLPASVKLEYVLGGLAPDTQEPMPAEMQHMLQQTWHRIAQTVPGTQFNHDFWIQNQPRRSTYPACRAVLAAKAQNDSFEESMITAIQQAYYMNAKNPSDDNVLIGLAEEIGCDVDSFKQSLKSEVTFRVLKENIMRAHDLGAQGFPNLFIEAAGKAPVALVLNYSDDQAILDQIDNIIAG